MHDRLQIFIFGVTDQDHDDFKWFREVGATSVLLKPYTMIFFLDFLKQMDVLCAKQKKELAEAENKLVNKFGMPLYEMMQRPSSIA